MLVLLMPLFSSIATVSWAFCFEEAGRQYGVNPELLSSIAEVESRLRPEVVHRNENGSVDAGLMQINSCWTYKLGLNSGRLLSDPCYNVMTGARVLRQCIDRYGYTWEAVGCYNASSKDKRVDYSWKIFKQLKKYARGNAPSQRRAKTSTGSPSVVANSAAVGNSKRVQSFYFRVRTNSASYSTGAP
jgi:soluble lytic murein transglycosylase-like protein